ncbi:unnamed protein product, partial [Ectocarpus sp. 8 AP-2014]
ADSQPDGHRQETATATDTQTYEAFCRGDFDDKSVRTRGVFERHGLLIDQFPPRPIGWDFSSSSGEKDGDGIEGSSFGSDGGDEGKGKGRKGDEGDDAWRGR